MTTVNPDVIKDEVDVIAVNGVGDWDGITDNEIPSETFSFGDAELIVIAPKNSSTTRFFSGFNYDEAVAKCGLFGAHLPILGNDS